MKEPPEVGIGALGVGFVEDSVVQILLQEGHRLAKQVGTPLNLNGILVKDPSKNRTQISRGFITTEPSEILNDPGINIIIELIGGESPTSDYIRKAISLRKHVVTANKDVMKGSVATEGVIMTHRSKESAIQEALIQMKNLDIVNEIGNMVRVEDWVI